ncbi:MAG: hypothetical protein QOE96_2265 [Blastocatellia bacterium]|jgi:hypothetical protein|nr:hypothetical protein [Blastocatellia bacterium]
MKHALFVLALIVVFSSSAISQSKTSKEIDGLVGPVHTVTTVSISLTRVGDAWTEGERRMGPVMTYDEKGNDGRFGNGNTGPGLSAGGFHKYNDKGQEIEKGYYGPGNVLVMKFLMSYDEAGHVIEETEQDGDGSLRRRHTFAFDDKGNMTSLGTYDGANKLTRKLTWAFDEKGNRTEWTESLLKGEAMALFERITYTYDDKANVLLQTQYGNPEGMVMKESFSYEFDTRGNWIKRDRSIAYADSFEIVSKDIDLRSITYFEK